MEPLVKLSLARNNMQYFVATYMYLDLPWEKPDTTTLSFLLQLIGYLIWQKLLSFCLKLMILLFVCQFAVCQIGWFPKFTTDKFAIYMNISNKSEVQTIIIRYWMDLYLNRFKVMTEMQKKPTEVQKTIYE